MSPASKDLLTVEGPRFAIVPEWVIDADISDCAFRLYAVLLRYGNTSGQRMPSRSTLARRLRKRSVDTVDRALRELVALGAVRVERRAEAGVQLTNRYHVRTTSAESSPAQEHGTSPDGGRTDAATDGGMRAARVAAPMRPDQEHLTESNPPRPEDVAAACRQQRRSLGLSSARWSATAVRRALDRAQDRGHPLTDAARALLHVSSDPATLSPMRVAEAGPWWDAISESPATDLAALELELDCVDGLRTTLQREARSRLTARGEGLTRATVVREAVALLRQRRDGSADAPLRSTTFPQGLLRPQPPGSVAREP